MASNCPRRRRRRSPRRSCPAVLPFPVPPVPVPGRLIRQVPVQAPVLVPGAKASTSTSACASTSAIARTSASTSTSARASTNKYQCKCLAVLASPSSNLAHRTLPVWVYTCTCTSTGLYSSRKYKYKYTNPSLTSPQASCLSLCAFRPPAQLQECKKISISSESRDTQIGLLWAIYVCALAQDHCELVCSAITVIISALLTVLRQLIASWGTVCRTVRPTALDRQSPFWEVFVRRNRSQVSDGIVCHAFLKRISALSDHQGASPSHRQTFGLFLFL